MADKSKPIEGRCNAQTATGYCHARPARGTTRCHIHGGVRERWALRQRKLSATARTELDTAIADPDLLDVRRPIALMDVVVSNTELLPDDERVRRHARRKLLAALAPEAQLKVLEDEELAATWIEPTDDDLEASRLELHERSMRMLAIYSKRQTDAVRQLEWTKVIREAVLPLLGELGLKLSRTLRKHVSIEVAAAIIADMRKDMTQIVGLLGQAREAAGGRKRS